MERLHDVYTINILLFGEMVCAQGNALYGLVKIQADCGIKNTVVSINDSLIADISETIINTENNLTIETTGVQKMKIMAYRISCRDMNVNQSIQNAIGINVELTEDDVSEMKKEVDRVIDRTIDSDIDNSQGFLSDFPTDQDLKIETKNIMRDITSDIFHRDTVQKVLTSLSTYQDMELPFGELNIEGTCEFTQNSIIELSVQQLMNLALDKMITSKHSDRILEILTAEIKSRTNGPIEAFGEKKSGKKGPLVLGAVALAVVGLIGGIIILIIRSSGNKSDITEEIDEETDTVIDPPRRSSDELLDDILMGTTS